MIAQRGLSGFAVSTNISDAIKSIKKPQTRSSPGGAVQAFPCLLYLRKPPCLECLCHSQIPDSAAAAGTSQRGEEAAKPSPAFFTCGWTLLHSSQQHWASQSVLPRASTVLGWTRETTTWKTIISTFSCLYRYIKKKKNRFRVGFVVPKPPPTQWKKPSKYH